MITMLDSFILSMRRYEVFDRNRLSDSSFTFSVVYCFI